jgi:hypothetical protein
MFRPLILVACVSLPAVCASCAQSGVGSNGALNDSGASDAGRTDVTTPAPDASISTGDSSGDDVSTASHAPTEDATMDPGRDSSADATTADGDSPTEAGGSPTTDGGPVSQGLLAWDDFDTAATTTDTTPPDMSITTGSGWAQGWSFHDEGSHHYILASPLLTYENLKYTGNFLHGQGEVGGRRLDVSQFADMALPMGTAPDGTSLIGKPGTTLWISVMLRAEDQGQGVAIGFSSQPIQQNGTFTWAMGTDGNIGLETWCLMGNNGATHGCSSKSPVIGTDALLVASIDFGSPSNTSLYVDPPTLGGAPPATPDATLAVDDIAFWNVIVFEQPEASYDEIRLGTSFASVTPTM